MKRRTLEELAAEAAQRASALTAKLAMQKLLARDVNVRRAKRVMTDLGKFLADIGDSRNAVDANVAPPVMAAIRSLQEWISEKARG